MNIIANIVSLLFSSVSLVVAMMSFRHTRNKDKVEGSLRLARYFHENLREGDVTRWRHILVGASDSAGAKAGHFISWHDRQERPFSDLFAEAPLDSGTTARMSELLNFIALVLSSSSNERQIIHFELGQFMLTIDDWLEQIPSSDISEHGFYQTFYPHLKRYMASNGSQLRVTPIKSYAALEAW